MPLFDRKLIAIIYPGYKYVIPLIGFVGAVDKPSANKLIITRIASRYRLQRIRVFKCPAGR